MENAQKKELLRDVAELRAVDGRAQTAINRLSGQLKGEAYKPAETMLKCLQGKPLDPDEKPAGLEAFADKMQAFAESLPDDLPDEVG